jgi:hypothetical protein
VKPLLTTALCVALVAALAGQKPRFGATATIDDPSINLAALRSYAWDRGQPSPDKKIDAAIVAAVDTELAALGMARAPQPPADVLVAYYSLTRSDIDVKAKPGADGARPTISVGTLVVALLEPASRRRLLRLRIDKAIDAAPDRLDAVIREAVAELFTKYPTRKPR